MKDDAPAQRVMKVRRDYNSWVATETLEDYALRFTPHGFRKWSEWQVANTAFGAASFLVLEAVGGTLLVNYGFTNAFWAILVAGLLIFVIGTPISYYAARYGVDMDLLTRGAGFGYIGSTLTSLIYASFTFIFFALEAAIMAYALELCFHIPPAWGYLICSLVVIPLVTHGITVISRLQTYTQPVWVVMLALPYVAILFKQPDALMGLVAFRGIGRSTEGFDWPSFGAALSVGIALITQMGEQVDYLRFMPAKNSTNRWRWYAGVLMGGPGWVVPGVLKMLGGALLAYLALTWMIPAPKAVDPNQMYLIGFNAVFNQATWALWATTLFVVISQLKINVTNAYAGSLAWSNFFSRLTHSHPGRVVWVVFNTLIALTLMELDVFQALRQVLGLYSNIAVSWMVVVFADLMINKPLGLSPPGIEFRRAYLFDINPVGVGALLMASGLSVSVYVGLFGATAKPFAPFVAIGAALVVTPLLAWATQGRYYLARQPAMPSWGSGSGKCCICEREYQEEDMAQCPAYRDSICSLCCSLDARCHDLCKPEARLSSQWDRGLRRILPQTLWPRLNSGLGDYLLLMTLIIPLLALITLLVYHYERDTLKIMGYDLAPWLQSSFVSVYVITVLVASIVAWWVVLAHKTRQVAQEELNRQNHLLMEEIDSHRQTDEQLQKAKLIADLANQAKSRYITAISHELRTPLNSILGYAQILDGDESIPQHRRQAIRIIRRSGDHLLSLIEDTLDVARIESGKFTLNIRAINFTEFMQQLVDMFTVQATSKGLDFHYATSGEIPAVVRADQRRLQQILINILGNALKFTQQGRVILHLAYQREMALFEVEDTGPGISENDLQRIFEPFSRGTHIGETLISGTGIGLTISKMLTEMMGGEISVKSALGAGSTFKIRLFLPKLHYETVGQASVPTGSTGYQGPRQRILVVDNEKVDRELLVQTLEPMGFIVAEAESGEACLECLPSFQPDVILMDLAMGGIDGWETIRRIRERKLSKARIAIVSANAFDKGLDNSVGIASEDFITKPVQMGLLLNWLAAGSAMDVRTPEREELLALDELVTRGYVRGLLTRLEALEQRDPAYAGFVEEMRGMAGGFRFDALRALLREKLGHVE
ncbi:MAG: response regulator [Betaproteobacteria bacterium]|nr:response regulator [Betaproteobacteria bacterium]